MTPHADPRITRASRALSLAQSRLDRCLRLAPADQQWAQLTLADLATEMAASRLVLAQAESSGNEAHIQMAQLLAMETAARCLRSALHLAGPEELPWQELAQLEAEAGPPDRQRLSITEAVLAP